MTDGGHCPSLAPVRSSQPRGSSLIETKGVTEGGISLVQNDNRIDIIYFCQSRLPGSNDENILWASTVLTQAASWHSTAVPQPSACPEAVAIRLLL